MTSPSSSTLEAAESAEVDDGGFSAGRYGNGRHQRQLQQRQNKQKQLEQKQPQPQRFSYADPMSDGTLRGIANPDFQRSTENFYEDAAQNQYRRPQNLPVFTVSGAKVAFSVPPGGESSTDAIASHWLDQQQPADGKSCLQSSRSRLILIAAIFILLAVAIVLVVTLPIVLVANRRANSATPEAPNRLEATGSSREISCGVLSATSVSGDGGAAVYRFSGIPYARRPTGTRLLVPARPIDSQAACAQAWSLTPAELDSPWFERRLRYPFGAAPVCLQFVGMGDASTAAMEGSADCLYLDVATPAAEPGDNLPTVVLLASLLGMYSPASLLLNPPDGLVSSGGIVAVSVRHRVGPLAFLTGVDLKDESPWRLAGNLALEDVSAALGWLRVNVRSFGGAANNVVLVGFGSSASVALSMAQSSRYDHLFNKLWLSSPPLNTEQTLDSAVQLDRGLASCLRANCRANLNASSFAASISWSRISDELRTDFFDVPALAGRTATRRGFAVIDGIRVVDSPLTAAMRWRLTKPMVLGSMLEDSAMYFNDATARHWPETYLLDYIDYRLSSGGANGTGLAAQASGWYRDLGYWNASTPVLQRYAQVVTDLRVTCPLIEFSNRLAAANQQLSSASTPPFYRYLMSSRPIQPVLPYSWSKFPHQSAFGGFDMMQLLGRDAATANQTEAWRTGFLEFARTGKIAAWQPFDATRRQVNQVTDATVAAVTDPRADLCRRWKDKFADLPYRGWYF